MPKQLSHSPDSLKTKLETYKAKLEIDPDDHIAAQMYEFFEKDHVRKRELEADLEWQKNNLEYDLRSTDWILFKVRSSESYAQNLYAALCNNDFQKNDVWPVLKNETWACSWRYAGGIVADMIGKGDYMDWYCSGILMPMSDEELAQSNKENQEEYLYKKNNYVSESVVTDEIREDLFKLGWIVIENHKE